MQMTFVKSRGQVQLALMLILAAMLAFSPACKSKKKLLAEKQARELVELTARTNRAVSELRALQVNNALDPDEKERRLNALRDRYGDLKDPRVLELFEQIEADIARARQQEADEVKAQTEAEAAAAEAQAQEEARRPTLSRSLGNISSASTRGEANNRIQETLKMFASENVPVLVVISEVNGMVDYDKPTTILKYLNYLKDTRNNPNRIRNIEFNPDGKIVELELEKIQ